MTPSCSHLFLEQLEGVMEYLSWRSLKMVLVYQVQNMNPGSEHEYSEVHNLTKFHIRIYDLSEIVYNPVAKG